MKYYHVRAVTRSFAKKMKTQNVIQDPESEIRTDHCRKEVNVKTFYHKTAGIVEIVRYAIFIMNIKVQVSKSSFLKILRSSIGNN